MASLERTVIKDNTTLMPGECGGLLKAGNREVIFRTHRELARNTNGLDPRHILALLVGLAAIAYHHVYLVPLKRRLDWVRVGSVGGGGAADNLLSLAVQHSKDA